MPEAPLHAPSSSADVFRGDQWLSACAAASGGRLYHLAQDVPLPGPILVRRIGPYYVGGSPMPKSGTPITAGLLNDAAQNDSRLAALGVWFERSRLSLLQVTSSTRPAECGASRIEHIQNLEIDLKPACHLLWGRVSTLPQRMVRKAVRKGIRIHRVNPANGHLAAHIRMMRDIFRAQGEAPIYRSEHYEAIQHGPLKDVVHMFMASQYGTSLGYLISIRDGDRAYYWDVAINPRERNNGAGHLLFWVWMRWCKRQGISRLDLIGPPEGGRAGGRGGIGRFKLSFGAEATDYWVVYWYRHGAGLALDASRWLARRRGTRSLTASKKPVGDLE